MSISSLLLCSNLLRPFESDARGEALLLGLIGFDGKRTFGA